MWLLLPGGSDGYGWLSKELVVAGPWQGGGAKMVGVGLPAGRSRADDLGEAG